MKTKKVMEENNKQLIKKDKIIYGSATYQIIGCVCLVAFFITILATEYFYKEESNIRTWLLFGKPILLVAGVFLLIPYKWIPFIFFDNREYDKNKTMDELVEKMRFRGVLFNNISILVFVFTIVVIVTGFWVLTNPSNDCKELTDITIRISASVMLLFLIQMLFRLFKYLLRVAAFYNGKADAIEFSALNEKMTIDKTIDYFTPDKYDISDIDSAVSGNLIDALKARLGIK